MSASLWVDAHWAVKYAFLQRQIENTLYRLDKYFFVRDSETFNQMFTLPPIAGEQPQGSSDENPIELEGQDPNDMDCFLSILYPL